MSKRLVTRIGAVLASVLLLAGCAAAPSEQDLIAATSAALEATVTVENEALADELGKEWFDGVAEDIVTNCDTPGYKSGYLASFSGTPSMADAIESAWDVGCP